MRGGHWLGTYGLILVAWAVLYAMALPADLQRAGARFGAEFWAGLCIVTPDGAGLAKLFLMWVAMSAAMMLPTALPALATYEDLAWTGAGGGRRTVLLMAGYLAIWFGFSALAAMAQMTLTQSALVSPAGRSLSDVMSALLLLVAGGYQFSTLKEACLSKCRRPISFFMQYWQPGNWNPVALGLRLGAYCLGCCWALMLLGFVGGTMNLAWMGLATIIMITEKLPQIGAYVTRPLGVMLLCGAVYFTARAAGLVPIL
ncbi:DUF2182 domain-containing protein [Actibacterium sp. XHP0104]|uniref:DUF2182 domain-containing protein n=1 Tax=Actibacterium sp. XHP0104 TaxID=2984335 RepID=UPI0021E8B235|nr:DUF2182 domain-containing protein [Actibacterium sp. XHP0104]MCV2880946.1 DUF2182 domain-containing protein [Actibacterium sp. XHP0104]